MCCRQSCNWFLFYWIVVSMVFDSRYDMPFAGFSGTCAKLSYSARNQVAFQILGISISAICSVKILLLLIWFLPIRFIQYLSSFFFLYCNPFSLFIVYFFIATDFLPKLCYCYCYCHYCYYYYHNFAFHNIGIC